jgi:fluoroacetyl-CoA thioesterase
MKRTLRPGLVHDLSYRVAETRTPWLMTSSAPPVRTAANDIMVGLTQWACAEAMRAHLDAGEHSVGLDIQILHSTPLPAGLVARVEVIVEKVEGRSIRFRVKAYDGARAIGEGVHERFVIDRERVHPHAGRGRARGSQRPARSRRRHDQRSAG